MIMKAREKWFTEAPVEEVVKAEDAKPAVAEALTEVPVEEVAKAEDVKSASAEAPTEDK